MGWQATRQFIHKRKSAATVEPLVVGPLRRKLVVARLEFDLEHVVVAGGSRGYSPCCGTLVDCYQTPPSALEVQSRADMESQVFRNLNSVTVPHMVSVPKNDEEDAKRGNQ